MALVELVPDLHPQDGWRQVTADMANGLFELVGALFLGLNLRELWRHRQIQGVHWAPTVFFQLWGVFNLWFYPSQELWWSLVGGCAIVSMNTAWLLSLLWLRHDPA